MKILKKLLFLACIVPIWPMLGMLKKENPFAAKKIKELSAEQIRYGPFITDTIKPNNEREEVMLQSLTLNEFIKTLNFGSKKGTKLRLNYSKSISITNPDYEKHLFDMEFVDFVTVHPKQRGKQKRHEDTKINDFYIFFNFDKVEEPFLDKMEKLSKELSILTEKSQQQKLEIEKLTKQNKEAEETWTDQTEVLNALTKENVQQKERLVELTQKNEELKQNKLEDPIYKQIGEEFSEATNKKVSSEYLATINELNLQNKQQKLEIEKLTQQNKEWGKKINDFRVFFDCDDEVKDTFAGQMETKFSEQLSILTEENKKQKLELEKFKQNKEQLDQKEKLDKIGAVGVGLLLGTLCAALQNKQQQTHIKELAEQNKNQAEELKSFHTEASARNLKEREEIKKFEQENEKLTQSNEELAERNKQQQTQIKELTEKNKKLVQKKKDLKKVLLPRNVEKDGRMVWSNVDEVSTSPEVTKTKINERAEKTISFFMQPKNLLFGLGGWLLLGGLAWAYSSFK